MASGEHKCPQNTTRNEVWHETDWIRPTLTLVGSTDTGRFEHNERINFCPYCGADLRIRTGCGVDYFEKGLLDFAGEIVDGKIHRQKT